MNYPTEQQSISIPISAKFRDTALKFAQEQPNQQKAKLVYLNTLAVQVVNNYLQMLDISTAIEASHSWDSWGRMGGDVADLVLTGIGHLECRYIRTGEEICYIPPEVWHHRFGYVVVEINQTCQEAKIRGFLPQVNTTEINLEQLQPLELFIEHYHQFSGVQLRQWLEGIYASQWQSIEELALQKSPQLVFRSPKVRGFEIDTPIKVWQVIEQLYPQRSWEKILPSTLLPNSDVEVTDILVHLLQTTNDEEIRWTLAEVLWNIAPNHPVITARRIMDLGMQLAGNPVALMVAILPKLDKSFAVLLRVYPMGNQTYLPTDLLLAGLYENGKPFLEVQARQQRDNYIQLKFCAELGEKFQIRVTLNNATITEKFVI
ncbi:DUF1822 family protein [Trichormus variabilis]|uniref:DUF1822 domain-containing protein n=1 Tax=Trichormus variabilis SAG 1403-4b TaxID=447716 RepID=A0A433UQ59_ANAVA|nr:DUF1822 family protein [Trichormus variabilis]MBD2626475.1 DUF1822 family protein [Trichormus variabilis FACHB-164]RUS95980.1 hypothetical protein DSM107003_26420 [Trichormus variabilis SAG 1403-4b]